VTPDRILAVDYGDRRTGLAATDHSGTICVPLPAIAHGGPDDCAQRVAELARERETQAIVVGLPLDAQGGVGHRAARTLAFVRQLEQQAPCPVATTDETHSTDEAHRRLKEGGLKAARRKKLADSVAALVILERYRAALGP
jgi:putative Holliday junction resolvase